MAIPLTCRKRTAEFQTPAGVPSLQRWSVVAPRTQHTRCRTELRRILSQLSPEKKETTSVQTFVFWCENQNTRKQPFCSVFLNYSCMCSDCFNPAQHEATPKTTHFNLHKTAGKVLLICSGTPVVIAVGNNCTFSLFDVIFVLDFS